jgi:NifU-like protein involved in Fe-S cluster formation
MFSETLLDHFQHPRNAAEIVGANVKVEVSNPVCGDVLRLTAIVKDGTIREIGFLCRGCTASIACASALTEMIKGQTLREVPHVTAESLSAKLGGLPEASFHAAQLAQEGLEAVLREAARIT